MRTCVMGAGPEEGEGGHMSKVSQEEKTGSDWVGAGRKGRDKNSRIWGKAWDGNTMLIWISAKDGKPCVGQ